MNHLFHTERMQLDRITCAKLLHPFTAKHILAISLPAQKGHDTHTYTRRHLPPSIKARAAGWCRVSIPNATVDDTFGGSFNVSSSAGQQGGGVSLVCSCSDLGA
mmetsp:Transcript_8458/g.22649  ORF Transcript_8458/g.22649 Transcript_8458/m.22649 type:complete len:104 (+) Transcript_8458:569-880(+)